MALGGVGQNTANYERGCEYRGTLINHCAINNIKIVDIMQVWGLTVKYFGDEFTGIASDNIHPTYKTSEQMGIAYAKAVLGLYN